MEYKPLATMKLYREAVRRYEKLYLYDHNQPAGPDLGYDRMVEWAGEANKAFVENIEQLYSRLSACDAFIDRLVEAGENIMECDPEEWPESCRIWQELLDEWRVERVRNEQNNLRCHTGA